MRQGLASSSVVVPAAGGAPGPGLGPGLRLALALALALAPTLHAHARAADPAYVDGPRAGAVADPARADGGGPLSAEARRHLEAADQAREDEARMAEVQRTIQAQVDAVRTSQAAAQSGTPVATPPEADASTPAIGGRSLLRAVRAQAAPDPSPRAAADSPAPGAAPPPDGP